MTAPAGAGTLVHERRGNGEPLVLIHGVCSRWQVWAPVLDRLSPHRELIAVDLPGFGASAPDGTEPTVNGYADRIEAFFDEIGVERPHVGGSSMGGGIALELGRRDAVRSATAFSPIGFWTRREMRWCQRLLGDSVRRTRALRPLVVAGSGLMPTRVMLWFSLYGRPWKLTARECVETLDAALGAPGVFPTLDAFSEHRFRSADELRSSQVLVAWGKRDVLLPSRQAARAAKMLPEARHVLLPGCGHLPFQDDPELCAALLLEGSRREALP